MADEQPGSEPPEKLQLAPLEVDARPIILIGTALWLIALVVLAVGFRHQLKHHHTEWWFWACGIGAVLGLYGLRFAGRHRPPDDSQD